MNKGNLTREQAIAMAGQAAVDKVDAANCEPTGRCGANGICQGDDECEYSASVTLGDNEHGDCLTAYYYVSNADERHMAANDGDGSYINWEIAGYEIT
jgi:hypothetical protein